MRIYLGIENPQTVFDKLLEGAYPLVACDTETVSLKDRTLLGLSIVLPSLDGFYFDIMEPTLPWKLMLDNSVYKIWHNGPFDLSNSVLGKFGVDANAIHDTALICRLMNIPAELVAAAEYADGEYTWSVRELLDKYRAKDMRGLPAEVLAEKCIRDSRVAMRLFQKYEPQIHSLYDIEIRTERLLIAMSRRGIKLDQARVRAIDGELEASEQALKLTAKGLGFNPLSHQQVALMLMDAGVWVPFRFGKPDTSAEVLEQINHPLAALTVATRKVAKLHSTYIHPLVGKDRAYSIFRLDALTGRVTSSESNLQNIPTGARPGDLVPRAGSVRGIYLPDSTVMTRADKDKIELRVAAYMSGDKRMQDVLNDSTLSKSNDIHGRLAARLGIARVQAKNIIFGGGLYGGKPPEVSRQSGIKDITLITKFLREWAESYPDLQFWLNAQEQQGYNTGYVTTLYGRRIKLEPRTDEKNYEQHIRNMARNIPVQASAAEIFKRFMLVLDSHVPGRILLQVHDEVLVDGHVAVDWQELSHVAPFWTPLDVRVLARWE